MIEKKPYVDPRSILYKSLFHTLKRILYDLEKVEPGILVKEENERSIKYSLKGKPDVFIDLRLILDPKDPRKIFTLALLTHIDILFQVTIDFYLKNNTFILNSWEDRTPEIERLLKRPLSLEQIVAVIKHCSELFKRIIKNRDILISTLFKEAGVIDKNSYLYFKEEEIKIFGEYQKFRFAIYRSNGKFKVLFDDIFSQNFTSVTNSIEEIAYHITQKYFQGNYENIEWFQIFSFFSTIVVQQIQLEPVVEKERKFLLFKERKLTRYDNPEFIIMSSFETSEAKRIFRKSLINLG